MKLLLHFLAATVLAATAAHAQSASRLATEWHVPLRNAPEKFALVDAATGTVRFATVAPGAVVTWSAPIPTGLADVTDACAGLPGASGEILALTSTSANRVILIDALSAAPFPRVMPNLTGIGPSGVAPIGTAPNNELLVATRANGVTPGRLAAHHDLSATAAVLADSSHATAFRRLQPLTAPGSADSLALVTGDSGANTRIELAARGGASHTLTFKDTFTNNVDFATNVRSSDHPARLFTIAYRSGNNVAQLVEFSVPLTTASTLTSNPISLPFPVSTVIPVHGGVGGNLNDGFLAIAADGSQAAHLRVNAAGNGISPPVQTFTAEPGTFLNGLLPVPGIGIVKLASSTPGGPSDLYHAYQWDGSNWVLKDSGILPALPAPGEILATLLFFNADPLADETARLLGVRHLASWTRRTSPAAVPANVLTENFATPASGLTSAGNQSVLAPTGTNYVLTNQHEPALSIAAAGDLGGLMAPTLIIEPASGTYHETFQVTTEYDESRFTLLFRQNGGNWQTAPENLPVAWTTTLEFTLKSSLDATHGPIVTRSYTLPVASLADIDSDNDGVPDYVELAYGLDPFGGSDSDGDGVSDLDEILQGTDPGDDTSTPLPNNTAGVSPEGGIALVATATNATATTEIALGEDLVGYGLDGSLIARSPVATLGSPLPDGGTRGAIIASTSPQPLDGLVAIHSPTYFDLTTDIRHGREIIAFFPATPPPPFTPAFTPSDTDLSTNAGGWISAAMTAAANRPPATTRSIAAPADAATAILLEEIVHSAITSVRPGSDPPAALNDFSFLPGRTADLHREFPSTGDRTLLAAAGFDFRAALTLARTARDAMTATAQSIYQHHATTSATTPGMALPIDVLRIILRGGFLPTGYGGALTAADLNTARNAYATARSQFAQAFRPTATWTVEILAAPAAPGVSLRTTAAPAAPGVSLRTTDAPAAPGVYLRTTDATEVALLNADGSRFQLERGLGLQSGARFTVTGFTDTPPAGSYPTMEITAAVLASRPAASDNDTDGNLLDDEWEKFFFGEIGQDPNSEPHGGGYTLLQYFLQGIDPRSGDLPTGPPTDLAPEIVVEEPAGTDLLDGTAALAFGSSDVGTLTTKTVTIRNTGNANLTGLAVSRSGANASEFALGVLGSTTLAPGTSTTFTVIFTPTAAGARSAALQIASNDATENPFDITLSGTGEIPPAPEIAIEEPAGTDLVDDSATLAFGSANISSPMVKTLTVRNTGSANLTGIAVSRSGTNASEFALGVLGATTLAPGASTTFTATFTPTAAGARSASLQISSNDADENPFDINLSGTGVAVEPFDIAFVGTRYDLRVGNQVAFDLNRLRNPGETLKVSGKIPTGLKYNALTGQLTGILAGKAGTYQVSVQVLQGRSVIRTIILPIAVLDFPTSLIGNFDFLMEDSNSVPIGVCKITITRANQWSATLESAGSSKKRSAKGTFILAEGSPVAQITAPFPADTGAPAVTVNSSLNGSTPGITGTYNGGTLRGFRIAKVGELPPATVAYSLVLDTSQQSGINLPAGLGWLRGKVSNQGIGAFKGLFGDGTAASISLRVSAFGQAILWSQPYKIKSSYIGGIVTLGNLGQTTAGQAPFEDDVWWTKTADATTLSYPSGFPGMPVTVGTSRWLAPASATAMGSSLGWRDNNKTSIMINGGGLSNQDPQSTTAKLPTEFTLDSKFAFVTSMPVGATPVAWKGKASKTDGAISGAFTIPAGFSSDVPAGSAAVSGVLVQDSQWGTTTGCGQIKVPVAGPKGSFKTASIVLGQ